jgi:hypothetical protein
VLYGVIQSDNVLVYNVLGVTVVPVDSCPLANSWCDGESRLLWAAWWLLCLSRDGFECGLDRCSCSVAVRTPVRGCAHACSRVLPREELLGAQAPTW